MSYRSCIEIVLQVESFRNVDILLQGHYLIQFQLYHVSSNKKIFATPYNLVPSATHPQDPLLDLSGIAPAHIIETKSAFATRLFSIKYIEELVLMRHTCQLRAELPFDPADPEVDFILKATLFR